MSSAPPGMTASLVLSEVHRSAALPEKCTACFSTPLQHPLGSKCLPCRGNKDLSIYSCAASPSGIKRKGIQGRGRRLTRSCSDLETPKASQEHKQGFTQEEISSRLMMLLQTPHSQLLSWWSSYPFRTNRQDAGFCLDRILKTRASLPQRSEMIRKNMHCQIYQKEAQNSAKLDTRQTACA